MQSKLKTGNWKPTDQELRDEWLSVKGIGPETADSICLYAFNRPVFVIDAYTRRFCKHYDLFEGKRYEEYQEFFESNLPKDVELYKEYHALIVEWGKNNSKPKTEN
jgi:endonuclease-3 related protein